MAPRSRSILKRNSFARSLVAMGAASLLAFSLCRGEEQAAAAQPGTSDYLLSESAQRLADGDFEGAIRDASLALQLDPKNPAAYEARGSVYIQEKLWDRAERDYASAAKLSPDMVYKFKLAEIKFLAKSYEDAKPRFVALESDPNLGDLATYEAFLCDLLGLHEAAALRDLAASDQAPAAPSRYFSHAAWDLYHNQRKDATKCFSETEQLYDHTVNERYILILLDSRRFQVISATFTDRNGQSYTNASVFLESAGLRVSTAKGWITLPLDQLPDDLTSLPEDLREQIDRKRAAQPPAPAQVPLLSFTTKSGQRYDSVRYSLENTGLSVLTPDGWKTVAFSELPSDQSAFPPELQQAIAEKRHSPATVSTDPGEISFTTKPGKTYRDVKVALGSDGMSVLTQDGWILVPFRELPDDVSPFPAEWQPVIQQRRDSAQADSSGMQVVSFTTKRGVHYDQVRAAIENSGLRLVTSDGLVAVPFSQLPTDLSSFPADWRETIAAGLKVKNTSP